MRTERVRGITTALFAAAFALLLCVLCSPVQAEESGEMIDGVEWEPWPEAPVCDKVQWKQVTWDELSRLCGAYACAGPSPTGIPACTAVSAYSEEYAKRLTLGVLYASDQKETVYEHEVRHIMQRLRHPKR